MTTFALVLIIGGTLSFVFFWGFYLKHYFSSKGSNRPKGKGNYEDFRDRFKEVKWQYDEDYFYRLSFYNSNYYLICCIQESFIIFDEMIMILGPIDYLRSRFLVVKKIRELRKISNNKNRILSWKEMEAREILKKLTKE